MVFPTTKVRNSPITLTPISNPSIKHFILSYTKELGSYTLVFCNSCDCRVQRFSTETIESEVLLFHGNMYKQHVHHFLLLTFQCKPFHIVMSESDFLLCIGWATNTGIWARKQVYHFYPLSPGRGFPNHLVSPLIHPNSQVWAFTFVITNKVARLILWKCIFIFWGEYLQGKVLEVGLLCSSARYCHILLH